ncbi:hypothetical protein HDU92_007940 [Lobulomyces angularis]|nr:hypothetical protein HDU92_007940 [Lobulomyces angularis]
MVKLSLNFDVDNDFVVDIDLYWKQLGYSRKEKATNAILKFLDVEKDYFSTTSCHDSFSETGSKGGLNIKKYYLTVWLQKLSMVANTHHSKTQKKYSLQSEKILQVSKKYFLQDHVKEQIGFNKTIN